MTLADYDSTAMDRELEGLSLLKVISLLYISSGTFLHS